MRLLHRQGRADRRRALDQGQPGRGPDREHPGHRRLLLGRPVQHARVRRRSHRCADRRGRPRHRHPRLRAVVVRLGEIRISLFRGHRLGRRAALRPFHAQRALPQSGRPGDWRQPGEKGAALHLQALRRLVGAIHERLAGLVRRRIRGLLAGLRQSRLLPRLDRDPGLPAGGLRPGAAQGLDDLALLADFQPHSPAGVSERRGKRLRPQLRLGPVQRHAGRPAGLARQACPRARAACPLVAGKHRCLGAQPGFRRASPIKRLYPLISRTCPGGRCQGIMRRKNHLDHENHEIF